VIVANKIVHAEVVGKDGPALHKFYGGVFGWKQNTDLPGGYAMTNPDDSGIILGTGPAPDGGAGWVTFYVWVDSIDDTLAKVEALGGKTLMPKFSPAPGNTLAMFADPEGHVIGLSE
jgi:predicted enzyme related to lactoylglutathione lyase